jgi:hypothetical protein
VEAVLIAVGALAVLHVAYSLWTARRLDRLHRRVDAARSALDAQLRRRAAVAVAHAERHRAAAVGVAARQALAVEGLGHDREAAENALSRALQTSTAPADDVLVDVTAKTAFARRFHNDTVRDVTEVRTRRIVRWFHLYGHAPLPAYFEIDDTAVDRRTIEV